MKKIMAILFIAVLIQGCYTMDYISSTPVQNISEQKISKLLIVYNTSVRNQSFLKELSTHVEENLSDTDFEIRTLVVDPDDLNVMNNNEKLVANTIKAFQPSHILRVEKSNAVNEQSSAAIDLTRGYQKHVFQTELQLVLMDNTFDNVLYSSLVDLDTWGSVRVELKAKAEKVAKRLTAKLREDIKM